ncbi:MAG: hypothetical protein QOI15_1723, partial [Pseudonocardiales bacterium]|nr:hypothetical protein [Pseudonocardiales bacterium]
MHCGSVAGNLTSMNLSAFFAPRSVAVVGASADPAKWGYYLAHGALAGADLREVDFVNVRTAPVFGRPVHASVRDLDRVPELVVVAVPGPAVGPVVDDALAAGSRAFVVVAADVPDPAALVRKIIAAGGRVLGPNSLGVFDAANKVHLAAWMDLMPGALAVVTQSGQVGRDIAALARPLGLGISRFVSVGPQLDITAQEALDELIDHQQTELVALYLEGFRNGRALVETITRLRAAGKPTIVIAVGSSAAGQHAAMSHTGALTAPLDVIDAACRAAGAVRVSTPTELVHAARVLLKPNRSRGNRLAIFSDSGGQGALAADLAMATGLDVPDFPPVVADAVEEAVTALVPHMGGTANPVDLANAGDRDMFIYPELAAIAFDNDAADAVLITGYFGQYGADAPELLPRELEVVERLADVADRSGRPIIVNTPASGSPVLTAAEARGVAVFHTVDTALHALAVASAHGAAQPRELAIVPAPGREAPAGGDYLA